MLIGYVSFPTDTITIYNMTHKAYIYVPFAIYKRHNYHINSLKTKPFTIYFKGPLSRNKYKLLYKHSGHGVNSYFSLLFNPPSTLCHVLSWLMHFPACYSVNVWGPFI